MEFYKRALKASKAHFNNINFTDMQYADAAKAALQDELRQADKTCVVTCVHNPETGFLDLMIDRAMESLPEHKGQDERLHVTFNVAPGKTSKFHKSFEA